MATAPGLEFDLVALEQPAKSTHSFVMDAKTLLRKHPHLFEAGEIARFHLLFQSDERLRANSLPVVGPAEVRFVLQESLESVLPVGLPPTPYLAWAV